MKISFLRSGVIVFFLGFNVPSPVVGMESKAQGERDVDSPKVVRILIAEDDSVTRGIYERFFLNSHYKLTLVEDGSKLCESYVPGKFDLIITDGQMPVMSGYDAVKQLVKKYENNLPPIIAVTADTSVEDKERWGKGVKKLVFKPFTKQSIFKVITDLMNKSSSNEPKSFVAMDELRDTLNDIQRGLSGEDNKETLW
ncbi:MAG: response regulator [Proteobacteria bacterium]|nr:response regulator [Pseudomonadota bacterium]